MKRIGLIFTLIGSIFITGVMLAQPGGRKMDRKKGPEHRMARMLDLSEEQQSKIMDLRLNLQKELIPLRAKAQSLRAELKLAQTADKFDQAKVNQLLNELQSVRTQMESKKIQHRQQVRSLLNEEQRKKFDAHLLGMGDGPRKFREHRGERRHKGEGPPMREE